MLIPNVLRCFSRHLLTCMLIPNVLRCFLPSTNNADSQRAALLSNMISRC